MRDYFEKGAGLRDHYQTYLSAGRLGREMEGTASFPLPDSLQFFCVLFSIPKESKGLGESLHLLTQSDNSWSTSLSVLNFVFQCKFMHLCCCFQKVYKTSNGRFTNCFL